MSGASLNGGTLALHAIHHMAFDGADPIAKAPAAECCEPRHRSWFTAEAERLLAGFRIAQVAAGPAVVPAAAEPGGWPGLAYHGVVA